jgi:uncharacterized protein
VRRIQREALPPGKSVTNGLQTNGVLIDKAWADFLARVVFSVGLSVDGPAGLHDRHRSFPDGSPSHTAAMRAFGHLKEAGVFCNLMCVITADNAAEPERVYGFFMEAGARYLQFLPLTPRPGLPGAVSAAASPEAIGDFLCAVFDIWIRDDVGRIVVQAFDEAPRPVRSPRDLRRRGCPRAGRRLLRLRPPCGRRAPDRKPVRPKPGRPFLG